RIGRRLLVDRRVCPLGVLADLRGRRELLDLEHRLELLLEAPDGLAHPQSSSTIVLRCSRFATSKRPRSHIFRIGSSPTTAVKAKLWKGHSIVQPRSSATRA